LSKSKSEIYPKDNVEICLREGNETLQINVESKSRDAEAKGRKVNSKKIGNKT
jgi:hypothetical protein